MPRNLQYVPVLVRYEGSAQGQGRTTKTWVAVLDDCLDEKGLQANFKTEEVSTSQLSAFVQQFYVEVCRKDGTTHPKASLLGIRSAIQRHLHSTEIGRPDLNIQNGEEFVGASKTLNAYLKRLGKERCLNATRHKETIPKEYLESALSTFTKSLILTLER